jgi:DnaJ-class molecular chaperone
VADEPTSEGAEPGDAAGPCLACRGTGRVISNLGGSPHEVRCPWCDGTGTRIPGHDAQDSAPKVTGAEPESA